MECDVRMDKEVLELLQGMAESIKNLTIEVKER